MRALAHDRDGGAVYEKRHKQEEERRKANHHASFGRTSGVTARASHAKLGARKFETFAFLGRAAGTGVSRSTGVSPNSAAANFLCSVQPCSASERETRRCLFN